VGLKKHESDYAGWLLPCQAANSCRSRSREDEGATLT
jgi:hypothetical protein